MAGVNWTPQQAAAIEARGGSLLVSAAAGSGKTAVLTERVMRRVFDEKNPTDIDRLLIVTFTEAAVAQMREKISGRLQHLLAERPGDAALRRQMILLERAHISTIDSFCAALVRQNFQTLGLTPDFFVGDENELQNLREAALRECAEEFYAGEQGAQFTQLAELISTGRDDRKLFETVYRLYDFIRSHPFYDEWLDEKLAMYDDPADVCETVWGRVLLDYTGQALHYCASLLGEAAALCAGQEKLEKAYLGPLQTDLARVQAAEAALRTGQGWDALGALLGEAKKLTRLGAVRGENENPAKLRIGAVRDEVKAILARLADGLFSSTAQEFAEDVAYLRPRIGMLFSLTKAFAARLDEKKRERRMVDFADLEHFALALLYDRTRRTPDNRPTRTRLALELADQFDEIMIDEYQDTNEAQNMIFSAVARGQEENLFLVGDVKQSIYRFRQAMPELFLHKKRTFAVYDGAHYPAKITLGANFRSRAGVTNAVNFVFRQLMSEELGELDYTDEEALIPRAAYPESAEISTELAVLCTGEDDGGEEKILPEARWVARRVADMLEQGYPVAEDGAYRAARPGDFCILLRAAQQKPAAFVRELRALGINAWADRQGGYLASREVTVMLCFLRVIDNPLLDIPLASVMLSELFAFTPDELAAVRLSGRSRALWLSVCERAREGDEKCAALMQSVERYGTFAVTEPADALLRRIYQETDYVSVMAAMPMGEARAANLRLLAEYAASCGQSGHKGLGGFVRFLDRVEERGGDLSPASTLGEGDDVVRVMTIHRSKGLEFPIVFLCDTAKGHNKGDYTRERTILHPRLGFACKRRDAARLAEYTTVPMEALRLESERAALSEELRVLYVAMTRAKEKLIITCVQNKLESKVKSLAAGIGGGQRLSGFVVRRCRSYADWLLLCALRHPDGAPLRGVAALDDSVVLPEESRLLVTLCQPPPAPECVRESERAEPVCAPSAQELDAITARTAFCYAHAAATAMPAKLGVSAVAEHATRAAFRFTRAPRFLVGGELSGAQRGSALHTFLQFADYAAAVRDVQAELLRMERLGYLTSAQRQGVEAHRLTRFFASPLYGRIAAAGEVRRELRFLSQVPATELPGGEGCPDETVTVQGVADCVFLEDGEAVIVDYKTDAVQTPDELRERYAPQLRMYRRILSQSLRIPVKECVLYSFFLGCEIQINLQ